MTKPFLTIGMATYEDFDGTYFATQALRMYHDMTDCEIIVVDNKPDSLASKHLGYLRGMPNTRYIEMPTPTGTAQPRNRVFAEAQGDFVLCMDSHVLVKPDGIAKLKQYWRENPNSNDLVSGPILWDVLTSGATHFDDIWRDEMHGIWGQAWECKCRNETFMRPKFRFAILQDYRPDRPFCTFVAMDAGSTPVSECNRCGAKLPENLPFPGHEAFLTQQGYHRLGFDGDETPFEVPGQGLGLFSARKATWEAIGGFNKDFRGFGGEELYIHEKIRRNGGKNLCLPFLAWGHRFARPNGVKFQLNRYQKVRNYVIGAQELGISLDRIEEHFVKSGLMPREQWDKLLADPLSEVIPPECETCNQNNGRPLPPIEADTPQKIADWCKEVPRDLNQHIPKLAELASKCSHVTEFTERRESTVGLFAGIMSRGFLSQGDGKLVSYNTETDRLLERFKSEWPDRITVQGVVSSSLSQIEETDLLFLDSSPHNYQQVWGELMKFGKSARRYIVFHDTESFGPNGQGGGPGLWDVMKQWITENPEWFVAFHTKDQYGLTVLSKNEEDKPSEPIVIWPKLRGPGTELKLILSSLGINPSAHCDCNGKARQMDEWGVEGCREKFDEVVAMLREGQERWGWGDTFRNMFKGGFKALTTGIVWKVSWKDPIPDLITMAINNAEKKNKEEEEKSNG